jgi:hypothetical protein
MDSPFAMSNAEYAELLEYGVDAKEPNQYYIDPRRICEYLDLTNINLDEPEWPLEGEGVVESVEEGAAESLEEEGVVESVEQEEYHEPVRASSVRIKSEPLSEQGITAARTGSVEVKEEQLSEDGVGEVEWVDVVPPMASKSPEIKQERQSEAASEYIPTLPPATTPWTIPEGRFVYHYPSPAATEAFDEDEEETVFDKMAKDLLYRIIHIDEDQRALEDDFELLPDAKEEVKEVKDIRHTDEMEGLEETAEVKTPMDCTVDFMPLDKALLHPDNASKLKAARCRRSPGYRRSPSNDSLSSTGSSSSRRSPKRVQRQKTDIFRQTLHKIREFTVDRVAVETSPFR